jgi:hypothetical protein
MVMYPDPRMPPPTGRPAPPAPPGPGPLPPSTPPPPGPLPPSDPDRFGRTRWRDYWRRRNRPGLAAGAMQPPGPAPLPNPADVQRRVLEQMPNPYVV